MIVDCVDSLGYSEHRLKLQVHSVNILKIYVSCVYVQCYCVLWY